MQCNGPSLLRISSSDHANITQYFPCIDHVSLPPYVSEIAPILSPHRKKSRIPGYSSLPCAPPSTNNNNNLCFRGVYDGFDEFVNDAHELVGNKRGQVGQNGNGSALLDRIALLLENLILHPQAAISPDDYRPETKTNPSLLEPSVHRQMTYAPSKYMANYAELHADYFESAGFVYSAILYDDPPEDLVGGETALVDFADLRTEGREIMEKGSCAAVHDKVEFGLKITKHETQDDGALSEQINLSAEDGTKTKTRGRIQHNHNLPPLELTSGMIVEPKRGRLVVFSSGGENFHAPMEVKSGKRPTYHFWFKCKSMNATMNKAEASVSDGR